MTITGGTAPTTTKAIPDLALATLIGSLGPTLAWAGLGGLMADISGGPGSYSALSIAYAVAAALSGLVPIAASRGTRPVDSIEA